jgi:hypothetical protein
MARTEEEWAVMASKYGYGIDANEATKDELVEFVQTVIYLQETADLTDTDVWAGYQELFEGFTVEHFKKIRQDMRSSLRKHLLRRGVYVATHNNRATLSDVLYEVTKQEDEHQWTDEEIEATIKELAEPMHTRALRDRLNQTRDGLATGPKLIELTTTAKQPTQQQLNTTSNNPSYQYEPRTPAQYSHNPPQPPQQLYNPLQPAQQYTPLQQTPLQSTVQQLHMDQSTYDPCLLQSNEPFGIVGLQTDDTLSLADETFAEASFDLSFAAQVINPSEGDAKDLNKRLMIDVICPRQAYEWRQITEVKWIDGDTNPADAMTKGKPYTAPSQLINTNRVELRAVGVG